MKMRRLKRVRFVDIKPGKDYVVCVQPYSREGFEEERVYKGSGEEAIELLKSIFNFEEWKEEWIRDNNYPPDKQPSMKSFLKTAAAMSGDGDDDVQIYRGFQIKSENES